jgi:hypothetical protein
MEKQDKLDEEIADSLSPAVRTYLIVLTGVFASVCLAEVEDHVFRASRQKP